MKLKSYPFLLILLAWVIVFLPILFIGNPGFYNDDFHTYQSLKNSGFGGSVIGWLNEYGLGYRPIGSLLHYSYYSLIPHNTFLIYFIYQLIYLMIGFVLYRQIYFFTDDIKASLFIAIFFLFFPFNAVAYWQIPSISMVIATLFSIIVIKNIVFWSNSDSRAKFIMYLFAWILLLFTYEQLLGLAVVMMTIIFILNFDDNINNTIKNTAPSLIVITIISLIFMIVYFGSSVNPKIISLESLNNENVITQVISPNLENKIPIENQKYINKEIERTYDLTKIKYFNNRINNAINYLKLNTLYSLKQLILLGLVGYLIISLLFLCGLLALFIPTAYFVSRKVNPIFYIIIGLIWTISTLAPFFLYNKVHIPPYTLMIPSIGLGIFIYGVLQYIHIIFPKMIFSLITKLSLVFLITLFPLNQFGYYFGLKEEIRYWNEIAVAINEAENVSSDDPIKITNIAKRENSHIFWLENAVGVRYIYHLTGQKIDIKRISHVDLE